MTTMRTKAIFAVAAAIFACTSALRAPAAAGETPPATQPTTPPATQPVGQVLRGRVSISASWTSQKPDLSRAVVFLASAPALDESPTGPVRATVSQRHKVFTPNFLAIPLGTEVEFPNWDDFDHNVFSRRRERSKSSASCRSSATFTPECGR
jgi:plastocyanin